MNYLALFVLLAGVRVTGCNSNGLAQRVSKQHRRFVIVEPLATESHHPFDNFFCGRETVLAPTVGRLHNQQIRAARLARFCRQPATELEIASVKERLPVHFDQQHRAPENMTRK
jgi:hypothetical protein